LQFAIDVLLDAHPAILCKVQDQTHAAAGDDPSNATLGRSLVAWHHDRMMTVTMWWGMLCALGTLNIALWALSARSLGRRQATLHPDVYGTRRLLMLLSGVYVFGCAYRCFFLVYDVPRICLIDSWFSSVLVGRSVATLAELSFVAQWAVLLRENSRATGSMVGKVVSLAVVPLIAIAETCSWYSVLTTSNVGHVAEETLWGLAVALLIVSAAAILPRTAAARRPMLVAWCCAGLVYVAFMFSVDVPMYWTRWMADEASGRHYLTLVQGLLDVSRRHVVSHSWDDWKNEVAWMSLYFSVAVWISISFIHTPPARPQLAAGGSKRLLPAVKLGVP
jgi:hypothetical protein